MLQNSTRLLPSGNMEDEITRDKQHSERIRVWRRRFFLHLLRWEEVPSKDLWPGSLRLRQGKWVENKMRHTSDVDSCMAQLSVTLAKFSAWDSQCPTQEGVSLSVSGSRSLSHRVATNTMFLQYLLDPTKSKTQSFKALHMADDNLKSRVTCAPGQLHIEGEFPNSLWGGSKTSEQTLCFHLRVLIKSHHPGTDKGWGLSGWGIRGEVKEHYSALECHFPREGA